MRDVTGGPHEPAICSAKGCRVHARHLLIWNNPKLHTVDREKTWAACDEHRDTLGSFLNVRGFLQRIEEMPSE